MTAIECAISADLVEDIARRLEIIGERLAHSHFLAALPRKNESVRHCRDLFKNRVRPAGFRPDGGGLGTLRHNLSRQPAN
jgi:hypothetical protein